MSKREKEDAEKDELLKLYMEQTGAKNLSELAENSYKQYGLEKPSRTNLKDEERLGKLDAQDILELGDEFVEEETNRLSGIERTPREEATYNQLGAYLNTKKQNEKRNKELKDLGIDETEVNNEEFKQFASNYKETTPLKTIYENYQATKRPKEKPFSAGSLQDSQKENKNLVKEYYSYEESLKFTRKDFDENPTLYKAICDSMPKWSKK